MPVNLARSDRALVLCGVAIIIVLIAALAIKSAEQQESSIPSSYSANSQGAKAAYLLLKEEGYNVMRWEQSPTVLPEDAAHTLLVLASPFNTPSKEERAALHLYLSRGGRVLATGASVSLFLPQADTVAESVPGPDWKTIQPQLLTPLTRGGAIRMAPASYWKQKSTHYLVHYADDDRPVVVSYEVGKGAVIWWAAATPMTNAGISAKGNLALLLNSIGDKGTRIFWDEYFHGYRASLATYIAQSPLLFGLLQCFLLLGFVLLTFSRRSLPIHPVVENSRLSPLEFVETLGDLYRRAKATHAALEVPYTRFRGILTRRLGLRADIGADPLAHAVRVRLGYKDETLPGLLRRIETVLRQKEPDENLVLSLTQELNRHMHKLKIIEENAIHAECVQGAQARAN